MYIYVYKLKVVEEVYNMINKRFKMVVFLDEETRTCLSCRNAYTY